MKSTKVLLLAVVVLMLVCVIPSTASVPVAQFIGTPTNGPVPLTVKFTDKSTNKPTGWTWYFGDETYIAPWTQMTASAEWGRRCWHDSVVMPDGSIVLMGGYAIDVISNDTWRSTDMGATWTQMTPHAGWSARVGATNVVMPDGSIVLMGGGYMNDTWRSTDNGATWTLMNASSGWLGRESFSSVVMPDGSIVLMGGMGGNYNWNDVWRSTDMGAHWTQLTPHAEWGERGFHTSVVMPDGSIVLMGGLSLLGRDVWRSTDMGAHWTQLTPHAEWAPNGYRFAHSSVVMPDGSIILMGGGTTSIPHNDVWRSTDMGVTWTQLDANAEWSARYLAKSLVMPDGSIVLMGGENYNGGNFEDDVWRVISTGSSARNPSHTYTKPGIYNVTLQAFNSGGYDNIRKIGYITVNGASAPVAAFTGTPRTGTAPLGVTFTDSSTGSISSRIWDFGDGNISTYTVPTNPFHIYSNAGSYTVNLTVTNAGESNSLRRSKYIICTPPPASITVTSPNGGETWIRGTTHTITWSYTGNPGKKVKIELLNGDALFKVLTPSTKIGKENHGSYSWKISATTALGTNYKIRVTSTSNSIFSDTSNGNFNIK